MASKLAIGPRQAEPLRSGLGPFRQDVGDIDFAESRVGVEEFGEVRLRTVRRRRCLVRNVMFTQVLHTKFLLESIASTMSRKIPPGNIKKKRLRIRKLLV